MKNEIKTTMSAEHPEPAWLNSTDKKTDKSAELFTILRTGEKIQSCLVSIANDLGDCDDAADLAEVVSVLDTLEGEHAALVSALAKISEIAEAGVIHRSETGKPQWSAFDEIKKIVSSLRNQ